MKKILLIIFSFICLNSFGQGGRLVVNGWQQSSGPTTYLSDLFTDTDGTNLTAHTMNVGSGWTKSLEGSACGTAINMTIQSNKAQPSTGAFSIYWAEAGVSDCVVSADLIIPNNNFYIGGLTIRYTSCANYYFVCIQRDAGGTPYMVIYEMQGGVQNTRATVSVPGATNSTVTVTVTLSGNSIVALASTSETCNYSSSFNATATKFGLWGYDAGSYTPAIPLDNFLVTN